MSIPLPRPLTGIVPPLVTPLLAADQLDRSALEGLIEHVLGGGVSALFILGTTGEGPMLSSRFRRELIDQVLQQVGQRVPVLVGITDSSLTESIQLAEYAAQAGASAVVAAPPYYFHLQEAELQRFVVQLAKQVPLPLFLYNMPKHTKVNLSPSVIEDALQIERIVGIKDSSGDLTYFQAVRQQISQRPDWTLLIGPEHLTAQSVLLGGHGGVNGGANLFPRLFVELYQAAVNRQMDRLEQLQKQVLHLGQIYQMELGESSVIRGLKCALALYKRCAYVLSEPFEPLAADQQRQIETILNTM